MNCFHGARLICTVSLIALFHISGCVPVKPYQPPPQVKNIAHGKIDTTGVIIKDDAGQFELRSGETFQSPFQVSDVLYGGGAIVWSKTNMIENYQHALSRGARKVRVTVPGSRKPLYGVLALNAVPISATGPASRSYLIRIPSSYVKEAQGGKVSVVYEPLSARVASPSAYGNGKSVAIGGFLGAAVLKKTMVQSMSVSQTDSFYSGWALWLSDMPFGD